MSTDIKQMENLRKGDIIIAHHGARYKVVARLEDLIWLRELLNKNAVGPIDGPDDIEDLIAWGFKVEES